MKRILLLLMLGVMFVAGNAKKQYVSLYINLNEASNKWVSARVSGDKPAGVKDFYTASYDQLTEGELINMLVAEGYVIENIVGVGSTHTLILMTHDSSSDSMVKSIDADGDAYEVARYNLQGIKVSEDTPGIQIVVYSNYTTRIIINE